MERRRVKTKIRRQRRDTLRQKVLGFFVAKGYLIAPNIKPNGSVKLDVRDVIEVGTEIEPRVLEVLPAALLHFPRTFLHTEGLPEKVKDVLNHITAHEPTGPDLAGIKYADMRRWADMSLKDKRTTPLSERRIMRSFRLKPSAIKRLNEKASKAGVSQSEYLERVLEGDFII